MHPQDESGGPRPLPPIRLSIDPELASCLAEAIAERVSPLVPNRAGGPGPEPLLDVKAVARRLSVSVRTVDTLIAEGHLRPLYVRGQRRFTPESVGTYIRSAARGRGGNR